MAEASSVAWLCVYSTIDWLQYALKMVRVKNKRVVLFTLPPKMQMQISQQLSQDWTRFIERWQNSSETVAISCRNISSTFIFYDTIFFRHLMSRNQQKASSATFRKHYQKQSAVTFIECFK